MRHAVLAVLLLALATPLRAELAPTGVLRVVFLGSNPVQGRVDPVTGAISGPVADLVPVLAQRIGKPYRIIPVTDAAAVMGRVRDGQADVALLAIEAARATQVEFSIPYLVMGNAYLVRDDSPIRRSSDVDRRGVVVGAVRGQSQQIWVSENLRAAQVRMWPAVPSGDEIVHLVATGEIQAFAANRQRMEDAARLSPQVRVLRDNFSSIGQALVVRKGNTEGVEELNAFVREAIASGLVKASIERSRLAGAEVAPLPAR